MKPDKTRDYQCVYCKRYIPGTAITRDHFIPKAKGGHGLARNKVWACKVCNRLKGAAIFATLEEARTFIALKRHQRGYSTENFEVQQPADVLLREALRQQAGSANRTKPGKPQTRRQNQGMDTTVSSSPVCPQPEIDNLPPGFQSGMERWQSHLDRVQGSGDRRLEIESEIISLDLPGGQS